MKEVTYGWYPPARDVMASYAGKQPGESYTKECLFKHSNSRYVDKPGIKTPQDPLGSMQWQASPQQVKKYNTLRRSPSPKRPSTVQSGKSMITLEIRGHSQSKATPGSAEVRPSSAQSMPDNQSRPMSASSNVKVFVPSKSYAAPQKLCRESSVRPARAWSASSADSRMSDLQQYLKDASKQYMSPHPPSPAPSNGNAQYTRRSAAGMSAHHEHISTPDRRERVKSATTYRQRIDVPRRSVMSAGPARFSEEIGKPATPDLKPNDHFQEVELAKEEMDIDDKDIEHLLEPELYYPDHVDIITDEMKAPLDPGKELLGVEFPQDYNEQLKKYGWRMQVHGDPLNLKKPCIAKRQSFTTKLPKPRIPPDPYKVRKENWDTFFLNTIPRKPLSFTIHQEWASEMLHAKRMELQKRDGDIYKYKHTDYAFIY